MIVAAGVLATIGRFGFKWSLYLSMEGLGTRL